MDGKMGEEEKMKGGERKGEEKREEGQEYPPEVFEVLLFLFAYLLALWWYFLPSHKCSFISLPSPWHSPRSSWD